MDLHELHRFINDKQILPFIDELVDAFYTSEINELIDEKCDTPEDRSVFLMYLIMYFYSYLSVQSTDNNNKKELLKIFLSDLIKNPDKRLQCIKVYKLFEDSINTNVIRERNIKKIISVIVDEIDE